MEGGRSRHSWSHYLVNVANDAPFFFLFVRRYVCYACLFIFYDKLILLLRSQRSKTFLYFSTCKSPAPTLKM